MKKMSPQISFTKRFIREVKAVRNWLDDNISQGKGRQFLIDLDDFIQNKIAPHPTHFMEWPYKRTPGKIYRRAIFKKKYVLVYKFFGNQVEFVIIYHEKRDPKRIKI